MKFQLTTWDRVMIAGIIGSLQGDIALIRKAGKVLDAIELTPSERDEIKLRAEGSMITWDDQDRIWECELSDADTITLLRERIRSHQTWLGTDRKRVIALFEALGIE